MGVTISGISGGQATSAADNDQIEIEIGGVSKWITVGNLIKKGLAGGVAIPVTSAAGIRAQVGGAGKTLVYINTDLGGELYYSATDPYGDGDTGFMAWSASGGGYWVRPWTGSVSVKWFGAVGNAVVNDAAAFNAADLFVQARGGGAVLIPPVADGLFYNLASLTLKHDRVEFVGYGPASHVRNTATSQPDSFTLSPGWVHENSWFNATAYDINPITQGDGTVTLVTAGDASNFAVNDVVWVVAYDDGTLGANAAFAEMRRIKAIDAGTGVLTVDYGFLRDVDVPAGVTPRLAITKLAGAQLNGIDCYICDGGGMRNFRISAVAGNTLRSSCYQGVFEDMIIDTPNEPWFGNGMGFCSCRRIKAFTGTGCEIAEGSQTNYYDDIELSFREGGTASSGTMLVLRHNSMINNLRINGGSATWAQLLKFQGGGGSVRGGYAKGKCTTKPVEMNWNGSVESEAVRNRLHDFTFDLLGAAPLQLAVLEGNSELDNVEFRNHGTGSMNQLATIENSNNLIRGCRFYMGGTFKNIKMGTAEGATLNALVGNYFEFPNEPVFSQIDYENNFIHGNWSDGYQSAAKRSTELAHTGAITAHREIVLSGDETSNKTRTLPAAKAGQAIIARNLSTTYTLTLNVKTAGTELIATNFGDVGATSLVVRANELVLLNCAADLLWYATRIPVWAAPLVLQGPTTVAFHPMQRFWAGGVGNNSGTEIEWARTAGAQGIVVNAGRMASSIGGARFYVQSSAGVRTLRLEMSETGLGLFGSPAAAKPTITGSRGGNAALADLLTKGAVIGYWTDGTTA